MNCFSYRDHELGRIDSDRFAEHAKQCPECQRHMQQDAKLMELVRTMDQNIDAPDLWHKIEQSLNEEQFRQKTKRRQRVPLSLLLRIAAVLVLVLGAVYGFWKAGLLSFGQIEPDLITRERFFTYRLTPTPQQRLYLDVSQIDVSITGHALYDMEIEARVTVQTETETQAEAWLEQTEFIVQPYRDYVRVGLSTPPDSTIGTYPAITGRLQIRLPAGQAIYAGNTNGSLRLTGVHGIIRIEGRNSTVEIGGLKRFPPEGRMEIFTTGKPVMLTLPPDADVVVTATTEYGVIYSDYPLYYFDAYQRRASLYLGDNNTTIEIQTTDGDIEILRETRDGEE